MARERIVDATGAPGAADAWFTPGRFALMLAGLIVVCFSPVVFGFETFYFRDFNGFGYPLAYYTGERLGHGELPLWNPLSCCGLPFLAQWNTMVLYPGMWLCLLFPLSWSLGMFCLGHLFFAGMGMYFLARRWTGNNLAASVAGVVFAFNGLSWTMLMWPNDIAGVAWMPWVVLGMERAWREGGRAVVVAGLAGAMQLLTGAPEVILFTWVVVGAIGLVECFQRQVPPSRLILRGCGAGALAAGLAAAQLLPFLDLLAHSSRDAGYATAADTGQWAMPSGGWANYLVPLFRYYKVFFGETMFFQPGQFWTTSYFLGIGTVLLAGLAFGRVSRDGRVWLLGGLTLVCLILALGDAGHVYAWLLRAVPALGFMRYPIKFVVVPTLTIPLLAALGLARWQRVTAGEAGAGRRMVGWLTLLLLCAMAVIVWRSWAHPVPGENPRVTMWSAIERALFLLAILACLIWLTRARGSSRDPHLTPTLSPPHEPTPHPQPSPLRGESEAKSGSRLSGSCSQSMRSNEKRLQVILRVGLLMLFWFDVFTHEPSLSPTIERSVYAPGVIRQFFHWEAELQPGESRVMPTARSYLMLYQKPGTNVVEDMEVRGLALFLNRNLLENVAKTDGFFSLELRSMHELFSAVSGNTNDLPKLEDFLGVAQISKPNSYVGWLPRTTFRPMITAGEAPVFEEDAAVLHGLADGTLDPTRFVYLPPEAKSSAQATSAADVKMLRRKFSAQRLEAEVDAAKPAWVVVAQGFYRPWRAYVDGQPVKLWRANYAFQALEVPAGRHVVRLVYQDRQFTVGGMISLASAGICVAVWAMGRKKARWKK